MIWPPSAGFAFFSSVAASSGRYLYMKMKKASEMMTLTAASQPLMVAAFSRGWDLVGSCVEGSASLRFSGTGEAPVARVRGGCHMVRGGAGRNMSLAGIIALHYFFDGYVGGEAQRAVA